MMYLLPALAGFVIVGVGLLLGDLFDVDLFGADPVMTTRLTMRTRSTGTTADFAVTILTKRPTGGLAPPSLSAKQYTPRFRHKAEPLRPDVKDVRRAGLVIATRGTSTLLATPERSIPYPEKTWSNQA
jgi:hypothetical protein